MRIFGWSASVQDGCWFYRMKLPFDELAKHGHETRVGVVWDQKHGWDKPDVVVGQRVSKDAASREWRKRTDVFRVYEMDDDLLNLDPSNPGYEFFSQRNIQENIIHNIQSSDRVVVSTPTLAEQVSKLNTDVVVVPNTVPRWLTESKRKPNSQFTVGWAGSGTHDMDWKEAAPHVQRWFRRNDSTVFHTIGERYGDQFGLGERYRHTSWTPSVPDLWSEMDFDIGLAPLRDHRFNHAKSALKALEYAALGIPVVASDVGPYRSFVEHGHTGFLVKREHEWNHYLNKLYKDPLLLEDMGRKARELASYNTIEGMWRRWAYAYGVDGLLPPKVLADATTRS